MRNVAFVPPNCGVALQDGCSVKKTIQNNTFSSQLSEDDCWRMLCGDNKFWSFCDSHCLKQIARSESWSDSQTVPIN